LERRSSSFFFSPLLRDLTCFFSYYSAYFDFYKQILHEKGVAKMLEENIFSKEANLPLDGSKPLMLSRFVAEIIHPLIHVAYGIDSGVNGIVLEGEQSPNGNIKRRL
jgi:hypothetical protein